MVKEDVIFPEKNMEQFYIVPEIPNFPEKCQKIDTLQTKIQALKATQERKGNVLDELYKKQRAVWTHTSNAIEGNTLTLGETIYLIEEGIAQGDKPFKDYVESKNHATAIDFLYENILKHDREINAGLIKEINALLLRGITHTPAVNQFGEKVNKPATSGEFKILPNHVLLPDGSLHRYVEPLQVPAQIDFLCRWIKENEKGVHPVICSAVAHYNLVRIHPFDDGNGRGARILMNLILLRAGYSPAIIRHENRTKYLSCINKANEGDLSHFIDFVARSLIQTLENTLDDLV